MWVLPGGVYVGAARTYVCLYCQEVLCGCCQEVCVIRPVLYNERFKEVCKWVLPGAMCGG